MTERQYLRRQAAAEFDRLQFADPAQAAHWRATIDDLDREAAELEAAEAERAVRLREATGDMRALLAKAEAQIAAIPPPSVKHTARAASRRGASLVASGLSGLLRGELTQEKVSMALGLAEDTFGRERVHDFVRGYLESQS